MASWNIIYTDMASLGSFLTRTLISNRQSCNLEVWRELHWGNLSRPMERNCGVYGSWSSHHYLRLSSEDAECHSSQGQADLLQKKPSQRLRQLRARLFQSYCRLSGTVYCTHNSHKRAKKDGLRYAMEFWLFVIQRSHFHTLITPCSCSLSYISGVSNKRLSNREYNIQTRYVQ